MSTKTYDCETCGKHIGNGNWVSRHLETYASHVFTEHWLARITPYGNETQITKGMTAQSLESRGIKPAKPANGNNQQVTQQVTTNSQQTTTSNIFHVTPSQLSAFHELTDPMSEKNKELNEMRSQLTESRRVITALTRANQILSDWVEDDGENIRKLNRLLLRRFGFRGSVTSGGGRDDVR